MGSALKASYGKLLSVALAAILVLAVYAPTQMPLPQAMAASIQITNQTTCVALPAEVSPEWIDPTCQIDSGTLVVDDVIRVHQHVVLEITSSSGVQLNANATLDNDGAISNGGFITVSSGAALDNSGSFTNTGTILNQGSISSTGNFTNSGMICGPGTVEGTISGNQPTEDCEDGGDEGNDEDATGSITGFKFNDENGNGVWDMEGEEKIGNVTICAFGDGMETDVCDDTEPETGEYLLEDLPLDIQLEVYEDLPEGYIQTAPADSEDEVLSAEDGTYFITLDSTETVSGLDFGNQLIEPDGLMYGTDAGGGSLYIIDIETGEPFFVGFMELDSVPSLAVDPTTGIMYAGTGAGDAFLYAVDPTTGEATLVDDTGLGNSAISGMVFDPEGTLYASVNLAGNGGTGSDHLAIIDTNTGEATVIGPYGECEGVTVPTAGGGECEIEGMEGLAIASDGTLFGATNHAELYTIDIETGNATFVASILGEDEEEVDIASIEFGSDGNLYAGTARGVGNFGTIDTSTGLFTLIGNAFEDSSLGALACYMCEAPTGTITGFKFVDDDGNGSWDTGIEEPFSGVTICADSESVEELACDTTDEDGSYQLPGLPANVDLEIYEQVPEGYEQTAPIDSANEETGTTAQNGTYFITLDPGQMVENLDFGNKLAVNNPPNADAGPAQTVDDSALVTLDGTGSSDEESDLEYSWTQLSGTTVTLTGSTTANPTFTAPSNVNTELSFNLTVTDGDGASDSATVSITVLGRGDITIRKVEQGTGTLLAGSEFTITPNPLTPTGTPTGSLTVADGGENDSDPADGVIKVAGVRFSTYTLVESQVPANHTKLVNSQTVVVNNGNPTPTVTVQNLHVEEEIEDEVEVPPPQLDEEEVEDLEDNGAKVDGQNVNSTNLPPAVITPPGQTAQVPKPVVFTNTAPPSTNGSSLFTSFSIPTYQAPQQSIANQTIYSPPAFVVPKANGSNFVLTPVIEEIFEGMTMLLTPPDDTAVTSASIQSVEIEFGQGGNDTGFSFDLSDDIPEGLPELDDIEEAALFLDVDFVGNVNFSDPNAFASPPEFTISVSRNLGGEDLPDGCPDIQLYLLNENTDEWETVETPERNPDGDTADECSYIVHTEHFSKFTIGSVKASISNVADSPGGGGGGGSRTVSVDGTFGQEYFDVHPLAKVSISGTAFIAPDGRSDNTFATGEQVHFTNTIRSHQRDPQPYIFVVQVLDSDGITQSLSWQSGLLDRAQEFDVGQSWLAEEAGDYQVRIYVWSGWDQPDPLSNVTVKVLKVTDIGPSQSA